MTTEVNIRPFNEVDAQFAYEEGEWETLCQKSPQPPDFWTHEYRYVSGKDIGRCQFTLHASPKMTERQAR